MMAWRRVQRNKKTALVDLDISSNSTVEQSEPKEDVDGLCITKMAGGIENGVKEVVEEVKEVEEMVVEEVDKVEEKVVEEVHKVEEEVKAAENGAMEVVEGIEEAGKGVIEVTQGVLDTEMGVKEAIIGVE